MPFRTGDSRASFTSASVSIGGRPVLRSLKAGANAAGLIMALVEAELFLLFWPAGSAGQADAALPPGGGPDCLGLLCFLLQLSCEGSPLVCCIPQRTVQLEVLPKVSRGQGQVSSDLSVQVQEGLQQSAQVRIRRNQESLWANITCSPPLLIA